MHRLREQQLRELTRVVEVDRPEDDRDERDEQQHDVHEAQRRARTTATEAQQHIGQAEEEQGVDNERSAPKHIAELVSDDLRGRVHATAPSPAPSTMTWAIA